MSEVVRESVADDQTAVSLTHLRMQRSTAILGVVAILVAGSLFGWRCAVGVVAGTVTAYLNMQWLHRGTQLMVDRMLATGKASKAALMLAFIGRLGFVLAVAYVIFISSQSAFYGFLAALFLPIAGAICEAVYEALPRKNTARSLD